MDIRSAFICYAAIVDIPNEEEYRKVFELLEKEGYNVKSARDGFNDYPHIYHFADGSICGCNDNCGLITSKISYWDIHTILGIKPEDSNGWRENLSNQFNDKIKEYG